MIRKSYILFITFLIYSYSVYSQTSEYLIKAGYIEKFSNFIEWPEYSNINNTSSPLIITVLGENPFNDILEVVYKTQKIYDKNIEIRYVNEIKDLDNPDVLFIAKSRKFELDDVLSWLDDKTILTISEYKDYGERGVIINFYITEEETVHFEINESKARKMGFKINVLLLDIAKVVN